MEPIAVGDIAGRVVGALGSIAAGLMIGIDALGVVEEGVGCSNAEVHAGAGAGIDIGQEEEHWADGDHLTKMHGGRIEAVAVVAVVADDSDTRLGWWWVPNCRTGSGGLPDSGTKAEVAER